jgi:rubrerythrin
MTRLWYCTRCGNVVNREDRPEKCFNCRTGSTDLSDTRLYEELEIDAIP